MCAANAAIEACEPASAGATHASSQAKPRTARTKVCHIITKLELGGAQQNTLYTVRHLDRTRFETSLICGAGGILDDDARGIPELQLEFSPALRRPISPFRDMRAALDLSNRLARIAPDVVHTHSSKAGIIGRWAAARAGVPVIVHTVHGWGFHDGQPRWLQTIFKRLERLSARSTTQWVAVSRANAETGEAHGIARADEFKIIYSGVHLDAFRNAARNGALRSELGLSRDVPLIGMVACLKPQKEPTDFVAVAERVSREHPNAHFVLSGDGELREDVERAVQQADLASRFHLLGWRRDPEVVVGDLDVVVLTSRHEGLPRVIPEAMAAGIPVVATAVDGSPEAVTQGRTGYLREFGDVDGLAADVNSLIADPQLRASFGDCAKTACAPWDIDDMVRQQEQLYDELLAKHKRERG